MRAAEGLQGLLEKGDGEGAGGGIGVDEDRRGATVDGGADCGDERKGGGDDRRVGADVEFRHEEIEGRRSGGDGGGGLSGQRAEALVEGVDQGSAGGDVARIERGGHGRPFRLAHPGR